MATECERTRAVRDGGKQPTARLRCSNAAEESDARRPATVSRIGDADAIALHV